MRRQVAEAESLISKKTINMAGAPPGSALTALGHPRNGPWFWRQLQKLEDKMFSPANKARIAQGLAPFVDAQWVKYNKQHAAYIGDKLIHHHRDQGVNASALPQAVHRLFHKALHRFA